VLAAPAVYVSFWGTPWPVEETSRLTQFVRDYFASDAMHVLAQYGITHPHVAGTFHVHDVHGGITDAEIQRLVVHHAPAATAEPTCLVLYLAPGIAVRDADTRMCEPRHDNAFGYHWFVETPRQRTLYYAVIPALLDACVRDTCPDPSSCSLSLQQTVEARRTQVTSHELAEMLTDPEGTAWVSSAGDENGDLCNGQPAHITVEGRRWTVQKTYSHAHRDCQATARSPIILPG
jgi:hypothetical protein